MVGRLFVDEELFGLFDTLSWHVMGGNSRVIWACRGRFDGCVVRWVPDPFGSGYEMSLFSDEMSMRRVLLGSGGVPAACISVVVAQESGLCLVFRYADLPVLGVQEHPFLTGAPGVPWSSSRVSSALDEALLGRGGCVGTAVATVLNLMVSDGTFTSASIGCFVDLTWRDYVGFLAEYAASLGVAYGSELMSGFDSGRVRELLAMGYLLVVQLEQGVLYDVVPGVFEPLPHRHLAVMAQVADGVVVADAGGVRVLSEAEVGPVFKGFEAPCYDGCMVVGIRCGE